MKNSTAAAISGVILVVLASGANAHAGTSKHHTAATPTASSMQVTRAIAYARGRIGCPYTWGGTGPCDDGYDCSGLVMKAYHLPWDLRTSGEQWAGLHHVTKPRRGDLVFFAGADGTPTDPGHVAIVLNPGKHTMIEAYATGFPVRVSTYGLPSSAPGDGDPVGFAEVR